jgi:hypothetical protein
MMPQPLPALYQTEVAYHAIMSAAHFREPRIPEPTHDESMHCAAIVSNLDGGRIKAIAGSPCRAEISSIILGDAETFCV